MRLLLISYGDFDYDGRLREIYKVFSDFGQLYAITRGSVAQNERHRLYAQAGYPKFIQAAVSYGKEIGPVDILVLDNRKSVIPGLLLRKTIRPRAIVQDCRELYVIKEVKHFAGKVGCVFEKMGIKRADVLICANQERASFMKDLHHLKKPPIVYENLRQLEYSSAAAPEVQAEKFAPYLHSEELRLITTSGCSLFRTNDVLVRNLKKTEVPCRLFMVGESSPSEQQAIRKIIAEEGLKNVEILGQLDQDALKYLISVCHVGVVNYSQTDLNNKYCASGKLYEFLYEGLPVVTTTNPPLKRLCDEFQIGVADDAYYHGIRSLAEHYQEYRQNVETFAATHTVEENNDALRRQLRERLAAYL